MLFLLTALVATVLFVHPYAIYPPLLQLLRDDPVAPDPARARPTATLVFCAYNEERAIPEKIANLRAIRVVAPDLLFKAYVDLGNDRTAALLREHPDLIEVHEARERTGKALGMRRLAAAATTEVMIFTDANVTVEPASVPRMLDYFTDPAVGGVCGTLRYINPGESATAGVGSAYWRLEELIKRRETRSGSTMGADGSIFATRRALYPEVPGHLLDDFIVSMSVVFAGKRLVSAPDVLAYERAATSSGDEFRRKRRIACRAYASHRHLLPQLRAMSSLNHFKYASHKLMRWYGALWAAIAIIAGLLGIGALFGAAAALACVAATALAATAALRARRGPLAQVGEMARGIVATMLGVIDAWRGKRYQTWQPPQSR